MSSVSSEEWSGGGFVVSPVHRTHAVDVYHAARNVREQLRRVEPPKVFFPMSSRCWRSN